MRDETWRFKNETQGFGVNGLLAYSEIVSAAYKDAQALKRSSWADIQRLIAERLAAMPESERLMIQQTFELMSVTKETEASLKLMQ